MRPGESNPHAGEGGADPGEHAEGGPRGGVLVIARHVGRAQADHRQVLDRRAHVDAGDVRAAEPGHEPAEGLELRLADPWAVGRDDVDLEDDGLGAPVGEVGAGVLERHHPGQSSGLVHRGQLVGIGLPPHPAEARAQGRIIDGDDRTQSAPAVGADRQLLGFV